MKSPILTLSSVSKKYTHEKKIIYAIQDISLTVEKGDVYGIIGFSGAGKSTLIRCIPRLITPSSGTIFFHEEDIFQMTSQRLRGFRQKVGMIFQHFNLLSSRTVAENIAYPLEITGVVQAKQNARVQELLKLISLEEKQNAYPSQLSGGEKQRVGIARALASEPEILLCDEATSALDPKTTREILDLLAKINRTLGVTILLITHEMEVIKTLCNQVAVLEKGKIIEQGDVLDIFFDPQSVATKELIQRSSHQIPPEFYKHISPKRKLFRLRFKGSAAEEPMISEIVRRFHVNANILLGWIDRLHAVSIGTLVIELSGEPENIEKALRFLSENNVRQEILHHG